ncbi:TIR domain-containing protein [Luteolibacter ambystomatis]|uniref:TIR domain-containing protein n=1 Tax=Luteolibacter ambystomatis TaxID=2824561 RepID=A0A975IZZ0_9BACT|nr:TIR domain-containing protein [Luteolibacter ambystomatis]QUE50880.1 TIR domain-containing protein [Luteolibacter ambystomatis]
METQPPARTFWCFISYRHADNKDSGRQWATWLHQQIETYEVPSDLVGTVNGRGDTIPERIFPVFRDEDELPANADLASPIYRALDASKFLVVLCSPRAVQSSYVADEIVYYKKIGRSDRVLAAILDGDPRDSFPRPLQHPVDANGVLIENEHAEPIAADFRLVDDTQGWTSPEAYRQALEGNGVARKEIDRLVTDYKGRLELGKLKIIAGVLGLPLGTLTQRDKVYQLEKERRRARIFRRVTAAMSVLLVAAIAGGVFASIKQREAEAQRLAAVSARDAEATARSLAESRRVEAEDARGVAETRRTEAEQAKTLAEQRRVESESRLAKSNILLADRLTREGNTIDAASALWEVPEHERQWDWGYLLGRAYPETGYFQISNADGVPLAAQACALDPSGRQAAFWGGDLLKRIRIQPDGAATMDTVAVKNGVAQAVVSRSGAMAFLDGNVVRVILPDGREAPPLELADQEPEIFPPLAFLDDAGTMLVLKSGESWRILRASEQGVAEFGRIEENFESERFCGSSADGHRWLAASSDTGVTVYDEEGRIVDKIPGVWQGSAAISEDGTVAVGDITESVELRMPDGKHRKLFTGEEGAISHLATGCTLRWMGKRLFVRTAHQVRMWDLRMKPPKGEELSPGVWEIPGESTVRMAVGDAWIAVTLVDGSIAIASTDDMTEIQRFRGHSGEVRDLRFPFDHLLASAATDGTLRYWTPGTHTRMGTQTAEIKDSLFKGNPDVWPGLAKENSDVGLLPVGPGVPPGTTIKVSSPDGRFHATTGEDGQVRLWKGDGTEPSIVLPALGKRGIGLAFSKDGRSLGAESFVPGEFLDFEQEWNTEPWTRVQLGIDASADWRKAYEQVFEKRFEAAWKTQGR